MGMGGPLTVERDPPTAGGSPGKNKDNKREMNWGLHSTIQGASLHLSDLEMCRFLLEFRIHIPSGLETPMTGSSIPPRVCLAG